MLLKGSCVTGSAVTTSRTNRCSHAGDGRVLGGRVGPRGGGPRHRIDQPDEPVADAFGQGSAERFRGGPWAPSPAPRYQPVPSRGPTVPPHGRETQDDFAPCARLGLEPGPVRPRLGPVPSRLAPPPILICLGLASSALGSVSVRTPFSKSALAWSERTGADSRTVRLEQRHTGARAGGSARPSSPAPPSSRRGSSGCRHGP